MALYGQTYSIKTVVGTLPTSGATSGLAAYASVLGPEAVMVAQDGSIYVADAVGRKLLKFDNQGNFSVVAGTGVSGNGGDGKASTAATLGMPSGLIQDKAGNIYVADRDQHTIRKIDTKGIITTIAGIAGVGRSGGDGKIATKATLNGPRGLALSPDGSDLYIADTGAHRVRVMDLTSGIIQTFVGRGNSGFSGDGTNNLLLAQVNAPEDVTFGPDGALYIADTGNNRIRQVKFGVISTYAGTGTLGNTGEGTTNSNIGAPAGVHFDSAGNLFFTDRGSTSQISRVRFVDTSRRTFSRYQYNNNFNTNNAIVANTQGTPGRLDIGPDGRIYFADSAMRSVQILDPGTSPAVASTLVSVGGVGVGNPAVGANLVNIMGLTVDPGGNLYVSDYARHQIYKVDAATQILSTFAGTGIKGYTSSDAANAAPIAALSARLQGPAHLASDSAGNIFLCDTINNRVRKVNAKDGTIVTIAGGGGSTADGIPGFAQPNANGSGIPNLAFASLNRPRGVAVDAAGNVYIADTGNHVIRMVDTTGDIWTIAGTVGTTGQGGDGGVATNATLNGPQGVAVDANGNVYFCDTANNDCRVISGGYIFLWAGVPGQNSYDGPSTTRPFWTLRMRLPQAVGVDAKGFVYVADTENNYIRRYDPNTGLTTNIAGNSTNSGNVQDGPDNATGTSTGISFINALAVDQNSGVVYFGTRFSNVVRALIPK